MRGTPKTSPVPAFRGLAPALAGGLAFLAAAPGCAAPAPGADLVIREARVLLETGQVLEEATIVVREGRIQRITRGEDPVRGLEELRAGGLTVVPGLIDSGSRLLDGAGMGDRDSGMDGTEPELPGILEDALFRGVTTIVSVGDPWPAVRELRSKVAAQEVTGPRILAAGAALTSEDGDMPGSPCPGAPGLPGAACRKIAAPAGARAEVRRQAAEGVDAVAVIPRGPGDGPGLAEASLEAAVAAARELGLPVVALGLSSAEAALEAVEAGVDVLGRPPGSCGKTGPGLAEALRERRLPVITALGAPAAGDEEGGITAPGGGEKGGSEGSGAVQSSLEACVLFLAARAAPVVVGTAGGPARQGTRMLREMGRLHAVGLTAEEVLHAATSVPGRSHPMLADTGLLAPGRRADLILLQGDPRESLGALARVKVVILEGRVVVDKRPR